MQDSQKDYREMNQPPHLTLMAYESDSVQSLSPLPFFHSPYQNQIFEVNLVAS